MQQITAEVEVNLPDGKKTIQMALKSRHDIIDCEGRRIVGLNLINNSTYWGFFEGVDEDEDDELIKISAFTGKGSIGFPTIKVQDYWEEIII